ncbi:MAG: polysaccharide deacetylase family protein [Acidimicrobiia bacterium]|nr:polysaccharide deacetylase family protein [Acidimicrobiia bacterium]
MRWRPTLAALGALAVAAALLVTMSSASVPTASASLDGPGGKPASDPPTVQPIAAATEPEPADGPPTAPAVVDEDLAEAAPPPDEAGKGNSPGDEDPGATDSPDATGEPKTSATPAGAAQSGAVPAICPDPSDSFFALYRGGEDCYWLRFEEALQQELTSEELELLEAVPLVAGNAARPLGRPARTIRRGPPGEAGAPRFYLTFDDGPSTRWTRPTLDLLDRYGARATFFPVGAHAELNFHLIEEIVARGHTIGSHLWSHERAALNSEELFRRELRASAELFGELGTNCLRTPFGAVNDDILEWAGDEGFEVVLWGEPDPRDWEFPGVEELTRSMLDMQNGSILILHEHTGADTLAALDAVLEALDARGWSFDEPICPLRF